MQDIRPFSEQKSEFFDLIFRLIERYDKIRSASANRAGIVLNADAILFAACIFLVKKTLDNYQNLNIELKILIAGLILITIILLIFSIYFATNGLANVWRTSRKLFGPHMPQRDFFHARDTIDCHKGHDAFAKGIISTTSEEFQTKAIAELWTVLNATHYRYQFLRKAIQYLTFSIIPLVLAIIILFLIA